MSRYAALEGQIDFTSAKCALALFERTARQYLTLQGQYYPSPLTNYRPAPWILLVEVVLWVSKCRKNNRIPKHKAEELFHTAESQWLHEGGDAKASHSHFKPVIVHVRLAILHYGGQSGLRLQNMLLIRAFLLHFPHPTVARCIL